MTKTSRWAGCLASFFSIAYFVIFTCYRQYEFESARPSLVWALIAGWCMMLAAFSGVVCLVSTGFALARRQRGAPRGEI